MFYLRHFITGHSQQVLHQVVGFTDELHVAVLDAVVHHLDIVAGPLTPHLRLKVKKSQDTEVHNDAMPLNLWSMPDGDGGG